MNHTKVFPRLCKARQIGSKISLFERDLVELPEDDIALLKRVLNFEKYQLAIEPNFTSNPAKTNERTDRKQKYEVAKVGRTAISIQLRFCFVIKYFME